MSKEKSTTRPKKSVGQVAENIKKYRKRAGISQDQLSKKADLAFHTIAKIEAGSTPNPTIETVAKIAKALEVSVDDLLK
jgi:transcriptional regulator with XRE-family HTH domain